MLYLIWKNFRKESKKHLKDFFSYDIFLFKIVLVFLHDIRKKSMKFE